MMKTFVFIPLSASRLKLGNLAGLVTESLQEIQPLLSKVGPVCSGVYTKLSGDVATMKAEMDRAHENPLTKQIEAVNRSCDLLLKEIKRMTKAGAKSTVPIKAHAGGVLLNLLEGFWRLEKEPVMTQITMTKEMLVRYNAQSTASQAATTLGIADLFETLETDNTEMDNLYHERLESDAQHPPAASGMRTTVVDGYADISSAILQVISLNSEDVQLVALFHKLDSIRKKYASLTPAKIEMKNVSIETIEPQTYAGRAVTPIPIARFEDVELVFTRDFTVTYKDNERPGEATVTLHGKGNFTGKHERVFMIV